MLGLLVAEGVAVCCGSLVGLLLILRALMAHRATVFSVFLAVPNTALRTLANKSVVIGDDEEESDDGAAAARRGQRPTLLPDIWLYPRQTGAAEAVSWLGCHRARPRPHARHPPPRNPRGGARRGHRGRGAEDEGARGRR